MRALRLSLKAVRAKSEYFGYREVPEGVRQKEVNKVFDNVADKYDLMNDVMSLGVHRLWKDRFVRKMCPTRRTKLLDCAGGTGDIAFRFLDLMDASDELDECDDLLDESHNDYSVTVADINSEMLRVCKQRSEDRDPRRIEFVTANAEELPFAPATFTNYSISFGIRNCTSIQKVVDEAFRVLQPGGVFMCLEFSQPRTFLPLARLYDVYSFQVIPVLGQLVAGDWQSYRYLVESIRKFPDQNQFAEIIRKSGFSAVEYENLSLGVAAIHSAIKL